VRRIWIHRIIDHDGNGADPGGIEAWLRLGQACGLTQEQLLDDANVEFGVRSAVDGYIGFARTQPWPVAIASSLTELFAPDLMATRLAAFEKHYTWIDPAGLDYFRRRLWQARRDSSEALQLTIAHCSTGPVQRAAVRALEFKCDLLWSMLDGIQARYG
jgi:pyrroloquinoline-quinone synthase